MKSLRSVIYPALLCLQFNVCIAQQFGSDPYIFQYQARKATSYSLVYGPFTFNNDLTKPMLLRSFSNHWDKNYYYSHLPLWNISGYQAAHAVLSISPIGYENIAYTIFSSQGENVSFLQQHLFSRKGPGHQMVNISARSMLAGTRIDAKRDGFMDAPLLKNRELQLAHIYEGEKHRLTINNSLILLRENLLHGEKNIAWKENRNSAETYFRTENHSALYALNCVLNYKVSAQGNSPVFGIKLQGKNYSEQSYFGIQTYKGRQQSLHADVQYQNEKDLLFTYATGISFRVDNFREEFANENRHRLEQSTGLYAQARIAVRPWLGIEPAFRIDHHSLLGLISTPVFKTIMVTGKYSSLSFLLTRSQRIVNIFSENQDLLTGSRKLKITDELNPEKIMKFLATYTVRKNKFKMVVHAHHLFYQNRVIADIDASENELRIYNLSGKSFENSIEGKASWEPTDRFFLEGMYRFDDLRAVTSGRLRQLPYYARHNAMLSIKGKLNPQKYQYYSIRPLFIFSVAFTGPKRLPDLIGMVRKSNSFLTAHTNITAPLSLFFPELNRYDEVGFKKWINKSSLSLGIENLTNYRQKEPVLFGNSTDSYNGMNLWGPTTGRRVYLSVRVKLP